MANEPKEPKEDAPSSGEMKSTPKSASSVTLINQGLGWIIGISLIAIVILIGVIVYVTFIAKPPAPRSTIEREIWEAQAQVKANPKDAQARYKLGLLYLEAKTYSKAKQELRNALKLDRNFASAWYALALVYKAEGKKEKAMRELNKIIKASPSFEMPYSELGRMYLEDKKYKEAIKIFQKSLNLFPYSADIHYLLGFAYEKEGQKDKAIKEYKEALKYVPDYKEPKERLKKLEK